MLTSPLEAKGERATFGLTERCFSIDDMDRIAESFDRYLGSPLGTLALKKGLHVAIENRMRVLAIAEDPPSLHGFAWTPIDGGDHPLDGYAAEAIATTSRSHPPGGQWIALGALLQGFALIASAVRIWLTAPSRSGAAPRIAVGFPAFGDADYFAPVRQALMDHGIEPGAALAVVCEAGYAIDPGMATRSISPSDCAINRSRWRRETVGPGFALFGSILKVLVRRPGEPVRATVAWYALHLARRALNFERVLHAVNFATYADISEYSPDHIVKAAILERHGGRLVRWPHCILDNPGASLSYLGYHLFLGTGVYESNIYGENWYNECRRAQVGFFKNDRRCVVGAASAEMINRIEDQRAAGRSILAYFGPSGTQMLAPVIDTTLLVILRLVRARPDWCVVVKAKGYGAVQNVKMALDKLDDAAAIDAEGRLIVVSYDGQGEPCPAGWLIQEMDVGIGLGSVQLEALTQKKPVFSYLPVVPDSPYQQKLAECGLGHTTATGFSTMLASWLADPATFRVPFDWFRANFDPFADDGALDRIVSLLWIAGDPPVHADGRNA